MSKRQKEKGQCHDFKMGTESQWRDTQTGHVMIKNCFDLICVLTIYNKTLLKQQVICECV